MRKVLLGGLVAAVLIGGASSALADTSPSGSTEGHESAPYDCPSDTSPGTGPGADDAGDCEAGESTYTVWEYDNQVNCTPEDSDVTHTPAADLYYGGDVESQSGYAEVCNSSVVGPGPVQGRVIVDGSADHVTVSVDGDGDNPGQGTGWVQANVDGEGPSVRCGDSTGNQDSQSATDADEQSDCG